MTLAGVDVSSYNGPPGQWRSVAGSYEWAGVKLTELSGDGTQYVNADAADDWAQLRLDRKARIAYLFGHPSASATETVSFFISELEKIGLDDTDAVCLDLEQNDGRAAHDVSVWAQAVMKALKARLGRDPVLYTFLSFAEAGNCSGLGGYPLWIADPSSPAGKPRVPGPWQKAALHQFSITSPIDRDVALYPTLAAMQAALGKPKPDPEDEPLKYLLNVKLAGPQIIPPDGSPVALKWQAEAGQPSLLADGGEVIKAAAAGVGISSCSLRFEEAGSVAMTLFRVTADEGDGPTLSRLHSPGAGWDNFTCPVDLVKGDAYRVSVTNYSAAPVTISGGGWQIVG